MQRKIAHLLNVGFCAFLYLETLFQVFVRALKRSFKIRISLARFFHIVKKDMLGKSEDN